MAIWLEVRSLMGGMAIKVEAPTRSTVGGVGGWLKVRSFMGCMDIKVKALRLLVGPTRSTVEGVGGFKRFAHSAGPGAMVVAPFV